MATRKQSAASGSSAGVTPEAVDRPSTPPLNYGAADHSFTLQAIMELQKSVGEMNATIWPRNWLDYFTPAEARQA